MLYKTKTSKFLLTLITMGYFIWFGGSIIRSAVAYDLFVPATELTQKNYYSEEQKINTVRLFDIGAIYTDISYCAALLSTILLFIYWRKNLKQRGWLFMAFILIFISAPVELILIYLDIKLSMGLYYGNEIIKFSDKIINDYFIFRYSKMVIPSTMSFLAYVTAIIFVIWRPLDKPKVDAAENFNDLEGGK
ncbi:MAG: hypothetical protein EPN82_11530 [Bacteroidetes bacterium]|nr:MAG: hypothetical protein EPN82_11530 [Bacteroidota bacterium]